MKRTYFTSPKARRFFTVVICVFALECSAHTALLLLKFFKGLEYDPIQFSLNEQQRSRLLQFVEGHGYFIYDPALGWLRNRTPDKFKEQINEQNIRASGEYSVLPPSGVLRVEAYGDSFVYGAEVRARETWTAVLEAETSGVEVLNFGVEAYGIDQALLRYRAEGRVFEPHTVLIGFVSVDFERAMNVFRTFKIRPNAFLLTKPKFRMNGPSLELVPNPLRQAQDYHLFFQDHQGMMSSIDEYNGRSIPRVYAGPLDFLGSVRLAKLFLNKVAVAATEADRDKEMAELNRRLVQMFYEEVDGSGARPIILIFPIKEELKRYLEGKTSGLEPFIADFKQRGYSYLDLTESFAGAIKRSGRSLEDYFAPRGHYSVLGNRIVAERLHVFLSAEIPH